MKVFVLLMCACSVATPALAHVDQSQRTVRQQNEASSRDVYARMDRTTSAVTAAERHGTISHRHANAVRKTIVHLKSDYAQNKRAQGFVSAGELASYNRSLDQADREIGRH